MKRKARKPAERPRYQSIDLGPHSGFEYKWANPASAKLLGKEGWKRWYRGTGPYRMGFDLLRRPIAKPPKTPKATRKDVEALRDHLTTWLETHR